MNYTITNWLAPENSILPDFIIGGAMKSGTSTLHSILNEHPNVFIPKNEINFFDIDNILQHSDFNYYYRSIDKWINQSMNSFPTELWSWYSQHFEGKNDLVIGEDSTTYLASKLAAKRISIQKKKIKLVFTLRQPTERAYSQYWHMLRSGRATHSFESTLKFNPETVINRSLYLDQLKWYFEFLEKDQIMVIIFEEFLKDKNKIIFELCSFLNLDFNLFPEDAKNIHSNPAMMPVFPKLQGLKNKLFRSLGNQRYINYLPLKSESYGKFGTLIPKVIEKAHNTVFNPRISMKPPKMRESTRNFLNEYFISELNGLDELLERDVLSFWFD
ncbi:MAG: sulfotransferase [Melioribacteraceae bacterium]|nr:sulfotransferase [Melioribacteraceae bacterium]MCF8354538.1 sulfotransferase [Melioribacteraceae bacterium]MCF8393834.1 sulfotransferase [Melioribacteraceae bacterium]MCF8418207.1 sulfotransferase [Melioribacteraceae bacterium]